MTILLDALQLLVQRENEAPAENLDGALKRNIENACHMLDISYEDVLHLLGDVKYYNNTDSTVSWNFIMLGFHILLSINREDEISVAQTKHIRSCFQFIVSLGLVPNLLPGVGTGLVSKKSDQIKELINETFNVVQQYYRLAGTVKGMLMCIHSSVLRPLIVSNHLTELLAALLQLSRAPLKKPKENEEEGDGSFTKDVHEKVIKDRKFFEGELNILLKKSHKPLIMRELMMFYGNRSSPPCPNWLKRAIFAILNSKLKENDGVESTVRAMIDFGNYDTGAEWKQLDVAVRLFMTRPSPSTTKMTISPVEEEVDDDGYYENVCEQVLRLLEKRTSAGDPVKQYEIVVANSVRYLYEINPTVCDKCFLPKILEPIRRLACSDTNEGLHAKTTNAPKASENVTFELTQAIRILDACWAPKASSSSAPLPSNLLRPLLKTLFRIYVILFGSAFVGARSHLRDLMLRCLNECELKVRNRMYEALLFDIPATETREPRKDLEICINSDRQIILEPTEYKTAVARGELANCFAELLLESENADKLSLSLLAFLLDVLVNNEASVKRRATRNATEKAADASLSKSSPSSSSSSTTAPARTTNKDLLQLEDHFVLDETMERKLITLKLLSAVTENPRTQKHLAKQPDELFTFIENVLAVSVSKNVHKQMDYETAEFQTLFVTVMILQAIVGVSADDGGKRSNAKKIDRKNFPILLKSLETLKADCTSDELKTLADVILACNNGSGANRSYPKASSSSSPSTSSDGTDVDKAIEDVCDPLLPVRAHGLMTLTKLIENKDPDAMSRKQYLLNIFQQNLKNDDSYIYLSAIGGLAAVANTFTDSVLTTLCDEFAEFPNSRNNAQDNAELRMKVGEVLVRVVKSLGDLAPKYKPLLLNTFLLGCKDDDHLIRASSLSNLGEICRVLGYKLGSIITEILVCVHSIIATDKALEARRAAVTVIRQLLVGLESETIAFLKEDILPIYRTLKNVYNNDPDDVMRLQAQLALEQLNENMKELLFPKLRLEKRVVMPN